MSPQYLGVTVAYFSYYLCTQLADGQVNGNLQTCLYQASAVWLYMM